MTMDQAAATELLAQHCRTLGVRVCNFSGIVQRQVNTWQDTPIAQEDWHHFGQVAAFYAFTDLGGSPDNPAAFDWNSKELFRRALSHLQQLTLGTQSELYDQVKRRRLRLTGSQVEELRWDAWDMVCMEDLRQVEASAEHTTQAADGLALYPRHTGQQYFDFERKQDSDVPVDALILELTSQLKPQEAVWLIRRYRDGESTATLAREFMQKDARYQTADGFTRAVRYIDVAIHRAKKKAQKLLAPRWHQLALEVA